MYLYVFVTNKTTAIVSDVAIQPLRITGSLTISSHLILDLSCKIFLCSYHLKLGKVSKCMRYDPHESFIAKFRRFKFPKLPNAAG